MATPRCTTLDGGPDADGHRCKKHCVAFLVVAFAWSWSCWLAAPFIKAQSDLTAGVLSALGGFGPSVAAVAVIGWTGGRQSLRGWLGRCLD
jgi:hypothetical protein